MTRRRALLLIVALLCGGFFSAAEGTRPSKDGTAKGGAQRRQHEARRQLQKVWSDENDAPEYHRYQHRAEERDGDAEESARAAESDGASGDREDEYENEDDKYLTDEEDDEVYKESPYPNSYIEHHSGEGGGGTARDEAQEDGTEDAEGKEDDDLPRPSSQIFEQVQDSLEKIGKTLTEADVNGDLAAQAAGRWKIQSETAVTPHAIELLRHAQDTRSEIQQANKDVVQVLRGSPLSDQGHGTAEEILRSDSKDHRSLAYREDTNLGPWNTRLSNQATEELEREKDQRLSGDAQHKQNAMTNSKDGVEEPLVQNATTNRNDGVQKPPDKTTDETPELVATKEEIDRLKKKLDDDAEHIRNLEAQMNLKKQSESNDGTNKTLPEATENSAAPASEKSKR